MSERESVSAPVPDVPSEDPTVDSPEPARRRDASGLARGTEQHEKRARDRVRLALRRARAELAELPPMARLRLVQEDIRRKAFLSVVFDEAKRRVLRQAPVNRAGEIRESVKVMFDAADRLHGWTESLLKLWPGAPAPERHVAVFEYEDPLEGEVTAAPTGSSAAVEVEVPAPEAVHGQAPETYTLDKAPSPPGPRRPTRDPNDMSDRLGWTTISGPGTTRTMTTTDAPTVVEIHTLGPTEPWSRSVARRDGDRVELRLTPIADCATCSKSIAAVACSCCGSGLLARLAIAHDVHGALLCMACLGKACGHAPAPDDPILRLVSNMESTR